MRTPPVLVEVVRGGLVESVHRGWVVAAGAADGVAGRPAVGPVGQGGPVVYPRSTLKPVQALAMVLAGFDAPPPLLALATASHSAEPGHLEGVRELLRRAGCTPADLGCPPVGGDPVRHNCSGKHAAMLSTCRSAGWPLRGYLHPDHPLQRHIRAVVERRCGPVCGVSVDGCGAPLFALRLGGLARAAAHLAQAPQGSAGGRVAGALRAHPWLIGGTGREITALLRAVPGLLAKDGAEGTCVAALPGGPAVAVKLSDGAPRGLAAVVGAAFRALGRDLDLGPDLAAPAVYGGSRQVGYLRAVPGGVRAALRLAPGDGLAR